MPSFKTPSVLDLAESDCLSPANEQTASNPAEVLAHADEKPEATGSPLAGPEIKPHKRWF